MPDLNIRIRAGSDETKTQQIFNQIASAILAGKFTRGDTITSERALAEQLGVSRNIVRNAYRRLEEHGLVETVSTSGRRVRAAKKSRATGQAGVAREDRLAMRTAARGDSAKRGNSAAKKATGRQRG
ncbi:MAG: GntR family transcriptional regulator [Acidobacteriota bacterium]|jgi:DNA-binding FadR family transcriptional regulator|nr:GntR family transcriptional regulator [Acidobacteriota bacterium]